MSISYSGIVGYGKSSLPSVESWGTNMNILRDPPKSISTRRIDKVGQTSSITELIDESGSRSCEGISHYARGVNPFVSVDYGNAGNNGGQNSGGFGGVGQNLGSSGNRIGGGQAYLPYRVNRAGSFRPHITAPCEMLPLSRTPIDNIEAFSKPGLVDYSKKLYEPCDTYREVKKSTIKASIRPTATYRMDGPLLEPFEVKYVIKNPIKFDSHAGDTGFRTQDITMQDIKEPTKGINTSPIYDGELHSNIGSGLNVRYADNSHMNTGNYIQDALHSSVKSNMGSGENVRYVDNSYMNTSRNIQDTLHTSVKSNISKSIQITPLEDMFDVDIHTKDAMNISYTPLKTGHTKDQYIHKDIELDRHILDTSMSTNKQRDIYIRPVYEYQPEQKRNRPISRASTNNGTIQRQSNIDLNDREYKLKPTISYGGMTGRGKMPLLA
jgi:hypothetical protein